MITRDQLELALDDKEPYKTSGIDHQMTLLSLLRERIPYDKAKRIISGTGHDIIYLTDIDVTCEHLNEEDIAVLVECNCSININYENLSLFV